MRNQYDAFWFPQPIRNAIITPETEYDLMHFRDGKAVADGEGGDTVTVRWPRLNIATWQWVVHSLRENRRLVRGSNWRQRLPKAFQQVREVWADRNGPLRDSVLEGLGCCTGHSPEMLDLAWNMLDRVSIDDLQQAATCPFVQGVKGEFLQFDGLPGKVRYFQDGRLQNLVTRARLQSRGYREGRWRLQRRSADMVLGFSAGSFPGAGLLLVLLSLASVTEERTNPPAVVVNGSAQESLFTPMALSTLELADPALVATVAVTLWDSTDEVLREYLVGQADLVLAAGCDEPMAEVRRAAERITEWSKPVRFHQRGHRVHLTTVGRESLAVDVSEPESGAPLLNVVALLASLDVVLGCQQGCQCSGVHFVEVGGGEQYHSPEAYCQEVVGSLRLLNDIIPMDVAKSGLRDRSPELDESPPFEEGRVFTTEDDGFRVVLLSPAPTPDGLRAIVDNRHGGEVFVIPVEDVMAIPERLSVTSGRRTTESDQCCTGLSRR